MLSYLEKYNQLSPALRQKFSSPEIMAAIKNLEGAYGVKLGTFVIKILVGDIKPQQGAQALAADFNISHEQANALMLQLKNRIFADNAPVAAPRPSEAPAMANEALPSALAVNELDAKLDKIMKSIKIEFASQELAERFKKIILTQLKGIRNRIATKEALVKAVASGGLGFDEASAENILRLLNDEAPSGEIKRPDSASANKVQPIARDVEYDLAAAIKARQETAAEAPAEEELLPPPPPVIKPEPEARPASVQVVPPPPLPEPAEPVRENLRRTESGKIKMEDIMGSPRVFTPVDEIKFMTVKNFRNLNPDPMAAVAIIKQKIEALAREDYSKKIAGIQGWKVSPVNRMYVETYHDAINEGKSVGAILSKKKKLNPEFISEAEFEAILTLNQDLKAMLH